ncbi:MAG: amidase domain-containing protein [Candidatus Eremiobacteraeota bacterium]|nr:amidase domain-containing protein [Candidatus Eremiobacteraeota bacterium]
MLNVGTVNPATNPAVQQLLPQIAQLAQLIQQQGGMGVPGVGMPGADQFNGSPDLGQAPVGGIPNFANSPMGNAGGIPNFANAPGNVGGATPTGGAAPAGGADQAGAGGGGAAARAVDIAKKYEGQDSKSLKGKLPGFTAPGGNTNNCAAFVSACLEHTGALPKGGGSASVSTLRGKLKSAGWKKVPGNQAPKGSVWMTAEGKGSHTELVASAGGKSTIGSNNTKPGFQKISTRDKPKTSGEFYAPPNG